jgi:hypothetical protein
MRERELPHSFQKATSELRSSQRSADLPETPRSSRPAQGQNVTDSTDTAGLRRLFHELASPIESA